MVTGVFRAVLPAILAGAFGLPLAHADIYTWVDASGTINVSNIAPPEEVRVTNILHARPPEVVARENAAREATRQAETQALAERVRQLEDEVALARRQAPPRADYRPAPVPPVIQYVVEPAAPPMQYAVDVPSPAYAGCDPAWLGCGLWWGPAIYPASVFVVSAPGFRRFPPVRNGHNFAVRPPMHPFGPRQRHNSAAQQPTHPFGLRRG